MNVTTALSKISYAVRGIDDDAPQFGTDEANYWLSVLNDKKDELYLNTKNKWTNIFKLTAPAEHGVVATTGTTTLTGTGTYFTDYQVGDKITVSGETVRTIATITSDTSLTVTVAFANTASSKTFTRQTVIVAGTQSYSLHRSFILPSDTISITKTDDAVREYEYLHPQERDNQRQQVYISGDNPKVITFTKTIEATADIVGGVLTVPGYFLPDDLENEDDILPFPDPNWGVMASAAEIAFNDIIYEDKSSDINNKANALFRAMAQTNRAGSYNNPRKIPTNIASVRIREPRRLI